ncbi:MAG: hypothetical protein ABI599_02600 [Flavobacteriales bacterium]
MRTILLSGSILIAFAATAQYGSFDKKAIATAKTSSTVLVLDAGDSPYNRAIMDAMKAHWKFTGGYDVMTVNDMALQPMDPLKTYLLKTWKVDPDKFGAFFLTLVQGWKQKKGEALKTQENAFTNIPVAQELAFIMIDPNGMAADNTSQLLNVYVKNIQDYLKQVEAGKFIDKSTADRFYASRNRLVRDNHELWLAKEHMDKSIPDVAAAKTSYAKGTVQLVARSQAVAAVDAQNKEVCISDVVMTGEYKTRHCFKRVFNAGSGELMYLADDAALYGKKEGFIAEDLLALERSR